MLIRRSFQISEARYQKSVENIDKLLAECETRLQDNAPSLLRDDDASYVDLQFAAMSGLWLMPPQFGGGSAAGVRIEKDSAPQPMQDDIDKWSVAYPGAVAHVARLYREQRMMK